MVTSFATQCDAITGSYFEDFEAYPGVANGATGGILPNCWTNLGTAQGGHIASSASSVVSGIKGLYLWTSGTTYIAFVALPAMSTLQSGNYKLKFDAKASVTANGILQIGYLDTSNAFVQLTTFSVPTSGVVYPFTFDLPALPAGVSQLALKNLGTPANSLSIDNLSYEPQVLSTSETSAIKSLQIYPNPVADILYFKSKTNVTEVEVYSVTGQRIQTIKDKNITSVNLQNLSSGVYLVNIKLENGQKLSKKIVKK